MNIYKICTKPTQFTKGKTEENLIKITERYNLYKQNEENHLIEIVITNNSMEETVQWQYRTGEHFKGEEDITIDILSSKSKSYKDIYSYIGKIQNLKNKEKSLPNILIMCANDKRVCKDLIELLDSFEDIKFHISFDEVDKNLKVIHDFICQIKNYIDNNIIIGITFITATPSTDFWRMLEKQNITRLLNMCSDNTDEFEDLLSVYRQFKDHNFIIHNNNDINPLNYIKDVFLNNLIPDDNEKKVIFAPAHIYKNVKNVGSHDEVVTFFKSKGYCVLLLNGEFKGFVYPNFSYNIELDEFKKRYKVKGELRDVLRKWNELNESLNLVITGNAVIERGITFNTSGFNFTHMILSDYFLSKENNLVQIAGRATGNKKFVDIITIICTQKIKDKVINYNDKLISLCTLNPKYMNRSDLVDTDSTIPVKVIFNDLETRNTIINLIEKHKKGYKDELHNILINGINDNLIAITDKNNINKFNILQRQLNTVRMYKNGQKTDVRRFKNFNEAFEKNICISQTGDNYDYNIDLTKDVYKQDDFINNPDTAWITFKV